MGQHGEQPRVRTRRSGAEHAGEGGCREAAVVLAPPAAGAGPAGPAGVHRLRVPAAPGCGPPAEEDPGDDSAHRTTGGRGTGGGAQAEAKAVLDLVVERPEARD